MPRYEIKIEHDAEDKVIYCLWRSNKKRWQSADVVYSKDKLWFSEASFMPAEVVLAVLEKHMEVLS